MPLRSDLRTAVAPLLGLALGVALLLTLATAGFAAPEKVAGGIRFTFTDPNAGSVSWAGEFNAWSTTANPLVKGEGGAWSVVLPLPAGEHPYKFVVDGQWVADPENSATVGEYGNSVVQVGVDGALVAQRATSNTSYSPKLLIGGRIIGLYQSIYSSTFDRFELTRPTFDIDLGFDVRISDVLKAHILMNINPENEDVQDYRSRLNYKRGSLLLDRPTFDLLAFDSEPIIDWDDPLHLVGRQGVFAHPFGYQRQGFRLDLRRFGWDGQALLADNFDDRNGANGDRFLGYRIDNYPTWTLGDERNPRFVFEPVPTRDDFPVATALALLQTVRTGTGFALAPGQATKLSTLDFGDDGRIFGYGDNNEDVFSARLRRELPGGFGVGLLGRTDRGFGFGRLVLAQPVADSTIRVLSALYIQQWYGGGVEGWWRPAADLRLHAEVLRGARRMTFANLASYTTYQVDSILSTRVQVKGGASSSEDAKGDHLTTDISGRYLVGGTWALAQGDIGLRGDLEFETHDYPAWTQAPVAPAGQPPVDHPRFETVEYQRGQYSGADRDLRNRMTTVRLGWDRNWRYYLNREVKTSLDAEWTRFDYDSRTAWEHQLWFPTGNFWLENGQHVVSVDRLTVLGEERAVRIRPGLEVPFWSARDARFAYRGTFSGVALDLQPRYAESLFRLGFDLTRTLRLNSDTRWVKYDAPTLGLSRGWVSQFTEAVLRITPTIQLSLGMGIDPNVLDPVTNEYAYIGRDVYLNGRHANGFIAETDYLSLAPQIRAAEQAMQDERRFQLQAIVHF